MIRSRRYTGRQTERKECTKPRLSTKPRIALSIISKGRVEGALLRPQLTLYLGALVYLQGGARLFPQGHSFISKAAPVYLQGGSRLSLSGL